MRNSVISHFHPPYRLMRFNYLDYFGNIGTRKVIPYKMSWDTTELYPEPQWLMEAWDQDKNEICVFVVKNIRDVSYI